MGGHGPQQFIIKPSRYQWNKFKDLLHFFVMLGVIPASAVVFYTNVFIGPAKLTPIPDGYVPKHWEYHRVSCKKSEIPLRPKCTFVPLSVLQHPISRFLSQYLYPSPQQDYEKYLHFIAEEKEKIMLRRIENEIKAKMAERNDYQAYYYRPAMGKYHRIAKEEKEKMDAISGDD